MVIAVSVSAFLMVWGIRYLENKENMALIERGITPTKKRRKAADPSRTLKNSLTLMGAGLGLLLGLLICRMAGLEHGERAGVVFSLIAILGGLGMLGAYLYERKNPPNYPEA